MNQTPQTELTAHAARWLQQQIPGTDLVVHDQVATTPSSSVYRVRSESIGRDFCAKFIDRTVHAKRWRREVQALAELNSPHIVKLFRSVEVGEEVVMILDWAEGRNLGEVIASDGPMDPRQVEELARQLATALHAVHGRGLVHRDVKPSNVMIDRLPNGDVFARLLDFGITKLMSDATTSVGFVGSPHFASPEQISESGVDSRTDVYQLGCVLFYALTGEPPFAGSDALSVMNAHLYQPATRPSTLQPSLRGLEIDDLVLKMLEKGPDERPPSCAAVLSTLLIEPRPQTETGVSVASEDKKLVAVGANRSVVTATGSRISVVADGVTSVHEVNRDAVTAIHPTEGGVYFGTASGEICWLDLGTAATTTIVRLPRSRAVVGVTQMADLIVAADAAGTIYLIKRDGTYHAVRCAPGQDGAKPRYIVGASKKDSFAVAGEDRVVSIFEGSHKPRRVAQVEVGFDLEQLAISPDGYIVAALGAGETWLLNALDGSVLHRVRVSDGLSNVTFAGGTLIGVERTLSGHHQVFELY